MSADDVIPQNDFYVALLTGYPGLTAKQIAKAFGVTPRTAARRVQILKRNGMIDVVGIQHRPTVGRPENLYGVITRKRK